MMKLVVLSCLLAAVSASGLLFPYASPYAYPYAYSSAYLSPYNYRGPLSLAPGQPANILGADGRPLDTLDVNIDRAKHFASKGFDAVHLLKKRSAPVVAPIAPIAPLAVSAAPVYSPAPISYSTYPAGYAPYSPYSYPWASSYSFAY